MKAGKLEKGQYILRKNEPYTIMEREFVKPGKGPAFVRVKLKHLQSGKIFKETIGSEDTIDTAEVTRVQAQYLYNDKDAVYFMDNENYQQFEIPRKDVDDFIVYMQEGETYQVILFSDNPIDIQLPPKVVLTVVESPEALKGDTATSVTKTVVCDTGAIVKTPGFIKSGEKIVVNTDTGDYVERASK